MCLDISLISDTRLENIFPLSVGCLFISLTLSVALQNFLV